MREDPWMKKNVQEVLRKQELVPQQIVLEVNVASSGPAVYEQELYIGRYRRLSEDYNGQPAYSKNTSQALFIYTVLVQETDKYQWVIGSNLGQTIVGIRNAGTGACVHGLGEGWMYAAGDDSWRDDDHTLTVECADTLDEVIEDLVNIELNTTKLTIGLKGIERNSVFKEESMEQKEMDITADSRDPLLTKKGENGKKKKFKSVDADMKEIIVAKEKEQKKLQNLEVTNNSKETVVEERKLIIQLTIKENQPKMQQYHPSYQKQTMNQQKINLP